MNTDFQNFIKKYPKHLDDPDWLSKAAVQLATFLYYHNVGLAKADLAETSAMVTLLDKRTEDGKKISVAEAETRAKVETENKYKEMCVTKDAMVEVINSIKKRVEVLGWERKESANG